MKGLLLQFFMMFAWIIVAGTIGILVSSGQTGSFNIVSTYIIEDEISEPGDIIAFDTTVNKYRLAAEKDSKEVYGVIQQNPVAVYRTEDQNRVPVAQFGESLVNVTDRNGAIVAGNHIMVSDVLGKGQLFRGEDGYVVGIALESFPGESTTSTPVDVGGQIVNAGSIFVLLDIGPFAEGQRIGETVIAPPSVIINDPINDEKRGIPAGVMFRYLIATIFAGVSLWLVFKNFGPNLKEGVISVGRNPLAKSTIQSMVTFNMLLILTISIAALLVSLVIILLPI
jgi:hypothetical protein